MPALQPYIIEPIFEQFAALLPERSVDHPLGCHRPRIPDRVVFEKLVQVLVFGCAYWRISDESCSATTLRRRRDEWIEEGVMGMRSERWSWKPLRPFHRPATGRSSRGRLRHQGSLRRREGGKEPSGPGKTRHQALSTVVDGGGIPLGVITAPANRHDSPLLEATLGTLEALGSLPDRASVHLDRASYDSATTHQKLVARGSTPEISEKGKLAPLRATKRWVVERTNSWHNAHKKLLWCTERRGRVIIDFWIAFSEAVIIVRRLVREAWSRYRWETRPSRRP